jgi:hypothetical protein
MDEKGVIRHDSTIENDRIVVGNRELAKSLIDSGQIKPDEAILVGTPQKHIDQKGYIKRPDSPVLQHVNTHEDLRIFEVPGVSDSFNNLIIFSLDKLGVNSDENNELHVLSRAISICVPNSLFENRMRFGDGNDKADLALGVVELALLVDDYRK